jgi:hypothetical protein
MLSDKYVRSQVPLKQALKAELEQFVAKLDGAYKIEEKYTTYATEEEKPFRGGFKDETPRFVQLMHGKRAANGSASVSDIEPVFRQMNKELQARGQAVMPDGVLAKVVRAMDTDEHLALWLRSRQEPLLLNTVQDETTLLAITEMLKTEHLDSIVDLAAAFERDHCSWESTIGPAVKALKRLGRTAAGKDFKDLVQYAKNHPRPS